MLSIWFLTVFIRYIFWPSCITPRVIPQDHDWGCEECKAEHEQLAEWLRELRDLREENKVLTSECDRLIKEKGKLLSKVSGGDVLKIGEDIKQKMRREAFEEYFSDDYVDDDLEE